MNGFIFEKIKKVETELTQHKLDYSELKGVSDGVVTPEKTNFIHYAIVSNNYVNYEDVVAGGYFQYNTGNWVTRADIASTGLIPCQIGDVFTASWDGIILGGNLTFWDHDEKYLGGLDIFQGNSFTIPNIDGVKYFRMSFYSVYINARVYIINKGVTPLLCDEFKDMYYFDSKIKATSFDIDIEEYDSNFAKNIKRYYDMAMENVCIKYLRSQVYKTTCWAIIINQRKFDGTTIIPRLEFTSGAIDNKNIKNVSQYTLLNDMLCVINGGIFYETGNPDDTILTEGYCIKDGIVLQDVDGTLHPNQYTLGIKTDGTLKAYPHSVTPSEMISDGVNDAVVGFVPIIEDGEISADNVLSICPHASVKNPRQIIGQLKTGDYIVFSCDGRTIGEEGMTLKECANTLKEIFPNIKFAYNLDGGGSTQTFVRKKRINRLIGSAPSIPNVIVFD